MPKQIPTVSQIHDTLSEFNLTQDELVNLIKIFDMLYELCEKEDNAFFSFPFSVGNYLTDHYGNFNELHCVIFDCAKLIIKSLSFLFDAYIDNHLDEFLTSTVLNRVHISDLVYLITRKPSIKSKLNWNMHIQDGSEFETYYKCVQNI